MKNIAAKIVGFFVGVIVMGSLLVGIRAYEKSQWRLESYEPDSYNWDMMGSCIKQSAHRKISSLVW